MLLIIFLQSHVINKSIIKFKFSFLILISADDIQTIFKITHSFLTIIISIITLIFTAYFRYVKECL